MIYTLTINPSLDLAMDLKSPLTIGGINLSKFDQYHIGGKGNNVATVLNNLGVDVTPIAVLAGFTGTEIESYLKENFNQYRALHLSKGFNRFVITLKNDTEETNINGNGPNLTIESLTGLVDILKEIKDDDYLVISGSLPNTLGNEYYSYLMSFLTDKNINYVVDTSQGFLLPTLKHKPFLIKPNLEELGTFFNVELKDKEDGIPYMRKLQEMGAKNILCSLGKDGAMLLTETNELFYTDAPKGKLVNSVGAGDSMVAGFLCEYSVSKDYQKALKFGVASGSASAFSNHLATKAEILNLLKTI